MKKEPEDIRDPGRGQLVPAMQTGYPSHPVSSSSTILVDTKYILFTTLSTSTYEQPQKPSQMEDGGFYF